MKTVLWCGLAFAVIKLFVFYPSLPVSSAASTGYISISVGISYSTCWEVVDNKPVLTVSASTLSHPGDIRVEVWRVEENSLGGRLSTKIDFFEWRGEEGKLAKMTWTFHGKARPVEYGDEVIFTPWGRTGK
jgi:hypothetical protein